MQVRRPYFDADIGADSGVEADISIKDGVGVNVDIAGDAKIGVGRRADGG